MRSKRPYIIVLFLFLFLLLAQVRNPHITGPAKGLLGNLINPFVYYASKLKSSSKSLLANYVLLVGVYDENLQLKEQLERLSLNESLLKEQMNELLGFDRLHSLQHQYNFDATPANVINRNTDGYVKYLIIDKGQNDNLQPNSAVVSAAGLVGIITELYTHTSKVLLIYHHDLSVSVMNERTRAIGVLRGDGLGNLYVDYYDRLDQLSLNDTFITSGMGQLYPKGLVVGKVVEFNVPKTGLFQKIKIDSLVDFYKLEQILVVHPHLQPDVSP